MDELDAIAGEFGIADTMLASVMQHSVALLNQAALAAATDDTADFAFPSITSLDTFTDKAKDLIVAAAKTRRD